MFLSYNRNYSCNLAAVKAANLLTITTAAAAVATPTTVAEEEETIATIGNLNQIFGVAEDGAWNRRRHQTPVQRRSNNDALLHKTREAT